MTQMKIEEKKKDEETSAYRRPKDKKGRRQMIVYVG